MGRQKNDDPTVIHSSSSIALLQERFRQLQRIKEMREERELLRVFADNVAHQTSPSPSRSSRCEEEQPKWLFHPDLNHPSKHLHGPSSSLRLNHHHHRDSSREIQPSDISLTMGLCTNNRANMQTSKKSNEPDVDTSLHL